MIPLKNDFENRSHVFDAALPVCETGHHDGFDVDPSPRDVHVLSDPGVSCVREVCARVPPCMAVDDTD